MVPHDVMPIESPGIELEFDAPSNREPGSSLLASMKKAGRALVAATKRNSTKGLMLAAMAAAGTELCSPAYAQTCTFIGVPASISVLTCWADPAPPLKTLGSGGPGGATAGDPVNVATGNVAYHVTDYKTSGPNPLEFTRYYNSMGNAGGVNTYATTLGQDWRSTYDRYLQIPSGGGSTVIAERADGQQLTFTLSGSTWVTDSDVDYKLKQSGLTWTLTDPDDTVEVYTNSGNGVGYLNTITARGGYQQTLTYDNFGYLLSVVDSYGRSLSFTYTNNLTNNMLTTVTTPDNLVLSYAVNSVLNTNIYLLTSVSYNTSPVTSTTYNYASPYSPFLLTDVIDENGNYVADWTYDEDNQALSSQNGGGLAANYTTFSYGSSSTTVTNAFGVADTYNFTTLQGVPKLTSISRAATSTTAAATESFGYDTNGYLNNKVDWNGNVTDYTNSTHGLPTSIKEAVGSSVARTTSITYETTWPDLPQKIIAPSLTSTFTYTSLGMPLTRTDADTTTNTLPYSTSGQTRETQWTWNSTGEMLTLQLPRTDLTVKYTLTWSGGALTSITDPVGNQTNITASTGGGYPTTVVDPNGVTTTLGWDTRLNLNTVTVATGAGNRTTTYTHDPANNLTAIQRPDGSQLGYAYDGANRLTTITDLPGNTINLTLDYLGDVTGLAVKNPSAATTLSRSGTFDALGRALTSVGGMSQTTGYAWDPNSNLLSVTDPLLNTVSFTYDALNRLATRVDPSPGGTTTITTNQRDLITAVKDANAHTTSYVYDGFNDLTQIKSPDTGTSVFYYDPDRNLTQKIWNGGQVANLTYDANDRNLTIAFPADSTLNIAKTYDQTAGHGFGKGRLTSATDQAGSLGLTYDERANITNESRTITGVGTLATATAFDAASNISGIIYPSGTAVAYTRNSMGLVTGITAQPPGAGSPSNIATGIAYEPFGPVTGLTFGNGVTGTYGFDNDYRPTSRVDAAASNVMNLAYAYYANNSLNTVTDGVNAANSQTLGYDAMDRMTSAASGAGGYGTYGWTWDKVDNVKTQVVNGATTTFTLNANTNQLEKWVRSGTTTTVDTTANGNVLDFKVSGTAVTSFAYNAANQMASATGSLGSSASYMYGLDGDRLLKTPPSGYPITYQYGQAAKELLAENDLHGGVTADYIVIDPGSNSRPVGEVNPTTGALYFLHTDRQGTVQAATNGSASVVWSATYNPFGDTNSFSGALTTQSLRLPGQTFDPETGYNHNGFRDYAGTLTRYVQSDPIGLGGGMNTYQYAFANPFKWTDRLGLDPNQNNGGGGGSCGASGVAAGAVTAGGSCPINSGGNSSGPTLPVISGSIGFGGGGNLGPFGFESDSGFAADSQGDFCVYANVCFMVGGNTPVGGSLGAVFQASDGPLSTGSTQSQGGYTFGGEGFTGEGQVLVDQQNSPSYGRSLFGVGGGGGGGYATCTTQYYCPFGPK